VPSARTGEEAEIQHDSFFAMTIADASRKYLGIAKATKSTADICAALERGGLKHSSKDFPTTVRSILRQHEVFTRVPNGDWGLTEWYPGMGRGKRAKAEKPVNAHAGKPKAPKAKAAKPNDGGLTRKERVLEVLGSNQTKDWTAGEIAKATGDNRRFIQSTLGGMVRSGEALKAERGYRFPKAHAA
jgi:hypothetical protein